MFVFSNEQFKTLVGIEDACMNKTLLDLGAGDGTVTRIMAKYFRSVYVTESSSTMRYRLTQKGFTWVYFLSLIKFKFFFNVLWKILKQLCHKNNLFH